MLCPLEAGVRLDTDHQARPGEADPVESTLSVVPGKWGSVVCSVPVPHANLNINHFMRLTSFQTFTFASLL